MYPKSLNIWKLGQDLSKAKYCDKLHVYLVNRESYKEEESTKSSETDQKQKNGNTSKLSYYLPLFLQTEN